MRRNSKEAIETLKGNGPKDLTELCLHICAEFLVEAKKAKSYEVAYQIAKETLYSGKALEKFKEFVKAQGGNPEVVNDYSLFKQPLYKFEILSKKEGKIKVVKALSIGHSSMLLGGGRMTKEDVIDMSAGIVLNKKTNDFVNVDDNTPVEEQLEQFSDVLKEIDSKMREYVDYIFDSNVSEVCVPTGSMYAPHNGKFRYEHITETLGQLYSNKIGDEAKLLSKRLREKTKKYTGKRKR